MTRIVKFETRYPPGKDPVDMVLLAPQGASFEKVQTWYSVESLRPPENPNERVASSDSFMALKARWEIIEPAYEAWKSGTEIPVNGTPLEAWSGVSPQQVAFLKQMKIMTVEDVRDMDDQSLASCRWPDARRLPKLAADYLSGADLAAKDIEIAEMRERMEAMEAMLAENMADKPKRGRPRKQVDAA